MSLLAWIGPGLVAGFVVGKIVDQSGEEVAYHAVTGRRAR